MGMKLDLKDKKIIYELDFNARASLAQLGRKTGLSKQAVKYRLEQLEKKEIIQGYYVDINPSKLGLQIYLVYLNFQNLSPKIEDKFIKHLSSQKSVGVSVGINGYWDYCIGIWAESAIHFGSYYGEIMKGYEKYVKNKTVMIETDFFYFKPKQIIGKESNEVISMSGITNKFELDEIDRKILSILSKYGRISLVNLASKVGLTPNAVKIRMNNLERKGIILGYRVMINYPLLGYLHYRVFLHLDSLTEEMEEKLISFLRKRREVVSVTKTIGYCELEFRAVVADIYDFYNLVNSVRGNFSEILKDYDSVLYYQFNQVLNYFPF